jgi:hypothetical protein
MGIKRRFFKGEGTASRPHETANNAAPVLTAIEPAPAFQSDDQNREAVPVLETLMEAWAPQRGQFPAKAVSSFVRYIFT